MRFDRITRKGKTITLKGSFRPDELRTVLDMADKGELGTGRSIAQLNIAAECLAAWEEWRKLVADAQARPLALSAIETSINDTNRLIHAAQNALEALSELQAETYTNK